MCWVHASERLSLIHFGKASRGNCQGQNRNREIRPSGLAGGPRKRDLVGYDSVRASRFYPDGAAMPRPTHRNIYVRSQRAGERVMESITRFLTTKLKLKVNQAKSAVAQPKDRKFLGFSFTGGEEPRRRIAPKAISRFKARIRELTCRTRGISMEQRAKELSAYLRGWRGYFGFCQTPSVLEDLDKWLRRRLRSAIWKQWKRGRKRFAELRKRDIRLALAARTAGSPHGPWRIANSPALAMALPKAYFDSLGIPR